MASEPKSSLEVFALLNVSQGIMKTKLDGRSCQERSGSEYDKTEMKLVTGPGTPEHQAIVSPAFSHLNPDSALYRSL